MANEPHLLPLETGWIEVICGGMFSGKTEELIRRANRAKIAGQQVVVVKPKIDNRYSEEEVVSHNQNAIPSVVVSNADQIILLASDAQVICIDEAQFFDLNILDVVNYLANSGKRIIIAGLDMDFQGKPFEPIPQLLAIAEFITKLHAVCMDSGAMASFSERLTQDDKKVLIGAKESYLPKSRAHFKPFKSTF